MSGTAERRTDVAIVGGGPAGAALAIGLARRGVAATVFERTTHAKWRACGVYSSPITRQRLLDLGLDRGRLETLVVRVPALAVQLAGSDPGAGTTARLAYKRWGGACGIDRVAIDRELLVLARRCGVNVSTGATVRSIDRAAEKNGFRIVLAVSTASGPETWRARLIVGADGPGSLVARTFGVQRRAGRLRRGGITFHVAAPSGFGDDARMAIGDGWYCGLCPVPGGRINVGIVIAERRLRSGLRSGQRPEDLAREVLGHVTKDGPTLATVPILDSVAVALPLANRVSRRAGPGFLLVGDACGFIDPISGEGFARALRSAELAADAIAGHLSNANLTSLADYDRHLQRRFGRKDAISWLLQAFLARPEALAYAVRRLEGRPDLRETFSSVMADLCPPERALDPRYLAALLRP
jgi:flavin-dependent dehydrogenase